VDEKVRNDGGLEWTPNPNSERMRRDADAAKFQTDGAEGVKVEFRIAVEFTLQRA
jgi:hypothetical protein